VPRRRRGRLWIGIAAIVVVVLAGGATVFFWKGQSSPVKPRASAARASTPPAVAPTTAPQHPGVEPPKAGTWPAKWQRFHETEPVRTYTHLDGLDFVVKVPLSWTCALGDRAAGYTRYYCGVGPGKNAQTGGEIVVRDCPAPCGLQRMVTMRKAEEAWGLQWIRGGRYSAYAESLALPIDDTTRYALVVVGYFRGTTDGEFNRQIVLRMTAQTKDIGQVRDVVDYLRDELIF
jgi:hypothetical protein